MSGKNRPGELTWDRLFAAEDALAEALGSPHVRHMIYEFARETLAIRDGADKHGWVMNPLPYEAEVRAALDAELLEPAARPLTAEEGV